MQVGTQIILAEPNATDNWLVCITRPAATAAAAAYLTLANCSVGGSAMRHEYGGVSLTWPQ